MLCNAYVLLCFGKCAITRRFVCSSSEKSLVSSAIGRFFLTIVAIFRMQNKVRHDVYASHASFAGAFFPLLSHINIESNLFLIFLIFVESFVEFTFLWSGMFLLLSLSLFGIVFFSSLSSLFCFSRMDSLINVFFSSQ